MRLASQHVDGVGVAELLMDRFLEDKQGQVVGIRTGPIEVPANE